MQKSDQAKELPLKTPQQAIERLVENVLKEVFLDQELPSDVRKRALEFAKKFEYANATYLGPEIRRAAGWEYDAWIDDIFYAVQNGVWRETLLRNFIIKLKELMNGQKSDALFALAIEEVRSEQQFVRYRLAEHCSIQAIKAPHWQNFAKALEDGNDRAFFRSLLDADGNKSDISVWHARSICSVYPYLDEFNSLVNQAYAKISQIDVMDAFWLSAIVLKSEEADQPHRLVFIAYANFGNAATPKASRTAAHEWRVMQLMRIAYRQLDHEISNLERRIAAHRPEMLKELSVGFLAHELNTHLANLHDLQLSISQSTRQLLINYAQDSDANRLGQRVIDAIKETGRVFQVVHGYNNLLRIVGPEKFALIDLLEQARALVRVRVRDEAKAKILLERVRASNITMQSDQGFLLVVLVNLLVNACQAIQEARPPIGDTPVPEGGDRIVMLVDSDQDDTQIVMTIANTGPSVPLEHRQRIFKRGFTTRWRGHGQGLYLCQQILEMLGGGIEYIDPLSRGLFNGAGFRISFTRETGKT
jgi:signal transduction histidine kinase